MYLNAEFFTGHPGEETRYRAMGYPKARPGQAPSPRNGRLRASTLQPYTLERGQTIFRIGHSKAGTVRNISSP
jgi:hypothetical protein